jgi:hypothetical protein
MNRRSVGVGIVTIAWTAAAMAVDVPLRYGQCPSPGGGFHPHDRRVVETTTVRPAGDWKLPALKAKPAVYALTKLGETERLFILDRKDAEDTAYNRIWFDANGNRDLTDDPVLDLAPPDDQGNGGGFPVVKLDFKMGGKDVPYAFRVQPMQSAPARMGQERTTSDDSGIPTLYLMTMSWFQGEFDLDGKRYQLLLADSDVDGRFDTPPRSGARPTPRRRCGSRSGTASS